MTVRCKCRHCDQSLEFDSSHAGQTIQCPNCQMDTLLFIPGALSSGRKTQSLRHSPALAVDAKEKLARRNILSVACLVLLCAAILTVMVIRNPEMLTGDSLGLTEVLQTLPGVTVPLLALIGAMIYFAPAFTAVRKINFNAIFALNFLLGWTLLGWAGALIWALIKERPAAVAKLQN